MSEQPIKWICGFEPKRDGEYPTFFEAGKNGIREIRYREQNLGTYGVGWFDVYLGSDQEPSQSMNAMAVAEVRYAAATEPASPDEDSGANTLP